MARYYDFAGQKIILPGAYTDRSFPEDQGAGAVTGRVLILGEATKGGIPYNAYDDVDNVINVVEGQAQAKNVYGGGTLYYGSEFYLTPTKDDRFNSPSEAWGIVVNQMVQASGTLTASATDIIDVKWNKFGTDGNTAGFKISAGTNTGKLVNIVYKGEEVLDQDDTTLDLLDIQYTGSGSAATLTIDATTFSTSVTGDTDSNLSITLAEYGDLGSLINYINSQANYTCTLTGQSDEKTTVFDAVTAQDIKTSAYSCVGIVEALIRAINSTEAATATLTTGATRTVISNMANYKYLSGGTVSNATTQDWTDALEKLEDYDVNCLVIMSGSETIHLLVEDHVKRMNSVKVKRYRQAIFGSGSATNTKALRIKEIKSLNSAYIEYCVSPFKRYDYINNEVPTADWDPFYLAPLIAGLRYANPVGMDIIFKYLNVLSTPEIKKKDQEDYASAGAVIIQKTVNVNNITQFEVKVDNTTYQGSQVTRTNPAVVYEINAFTKDFEEAITEEVRKLDTVADSIIIAKIQNWILTERFPYYRDSLKWITDGPNGQKAFSNVTFSQNGEVFEVSATLTMSVTPRFIFNLFTFITPGQNV